MTPDAESRGPGRDSREDAVAQRLGAALAAVLDASHLARADDLPRIADQGARIVGASSATLHVVDYDQSVLVPLSADRAVVAVDGTLPGRAYAGVSLELSAEGTLWVPLLDGTDRLGVVAFDFPDVPPDDGVRDSCRVVASMLAELIATRSAYGDAIERARRRVPMTVPAELQWRLLPPLTFVTPRVAIAGVLAPTAEVAGDSFDYAVNGDVAHVAVLDAMGHGLEAALLASVAVSGMRNARRAGLALAETVRVMDELISTTFAPDRFVTAVVGELDTLDGTWRWITCGHPPALVVRQGKVVKELDSPRLPPLGLLPRDLAVGEERLEPGDRLFLYTDGVVEARDEDGRFFGVERLVEFVTREAASGRPAPEALRRLNLAIMGHQAGALQDDATTVMVEWLTDEPRRTSM